MAKILFYPERRKNEMGILRVKNVPILLFFSFEGHRLQYYSGERIDLKDWDFKNRRVQSTNPGYISINEHLDFLSRRVLEAYRELKVSGQELTIAALRLKFKEVLKKNNSTFFDILILFIEENNRNWSLATYRKIKSFYNHLRKFTSIAGTEPEFSSMDDKFFSGLIGYFRKECKHIDSTIRKNLEVFSWFMNWALKKGFVKNNDFRIHLDRYLSLNHSISHDLSLSIEEVNRIKTIEVSDKKEMFARDLFVFSCLTGFSCDEMRQLRPIDIEDNWIRINSGKRIRSVPLSEGSRIIIKRYLQADKSTVFPKIYPAKINRYLKEIGKKTGLRREISKTKFLNGEKLDDSNEAYRFLTLSVARKTFIHIALDLGISPLVVAQTAGYKTMNTVDLQSKKMDQLKQQEFRKFNLNSN